MDPMDWLEDEELLRFLHRCKTELSCMENPHTFLSQLRDYDLVPEERYKKVSRMKSKDNMRKGLYDILDWLEREQSQRVREFWRCVFKDTILNQYPTLKLLRNSLLDGSFHFDKQPAETVETEESDEGKRKQLSEGEEGKEKQENSVKKKRKLRSHGVCDDEEEQAGPSSRLTPRKKSKKICFSSPLKKGGEDCIWLWPIYKLQLPVTCGDQDGTLNRDRLAKGEKCIVVGKKWFTPSEFERFAGKESSRNWKLSIRCRDTPLGTLIQEGHLKAVKYKGGCKKVKKSLFPSGHATAEEEDEEDEDEEEEEEGSDLDEEDRSSSSSKESSTAVTDEGKRKQLSEGEEGKEKQENSVKKKRKRRSHGVSDDEEEQAGPSSRLTPRQKSKKICFSSPLKKGGEDCIWLWPKYKLQLPVTCGDQDGTLNRDRLAKGEKCIVVGKKWFTPSEFERFAGKESFRNWKLSIRCQDTPLGTLIKEGHLKAVKYKGGCKKVKKSQFPSGHATAEEEEEEVEEEEEEEERSDLDEEDRSSSSSKESSTAVTGEQVKQPTEPQPEVGREGGRKVFRVTCGAAAGNLHKKRFASGTCGKSIRTETSWMTPVEFLKVAQCPANAYWKKDIEWEGEPLGDLIKANILRIHSLLCNCRLCKPDGTDLENQKNDDECSVCRREDEDELVVCDYCPRSFHQKCHLPHVEDFILRDDSLWKCTFCKIRTKRPCFYWEELEREAAMTLQRMLQCQYLLLCLCTADEEQIFTENPHLYLNDYSGVIRTPMWLGHIADQLQKQLYQTVGEFVTDVQLIFSNCALYNRDNAEFLTTGNRLKELFDREFKSVFNINE